MPATTPAPGPAASGILAGRTVLVTGVLTQDSIAFHVARQAQEQGAKVLLTGFGRMSLIQRMAKRLPDPDVPVLELDITDPEHCASLADRIREYTDHLDGVLHAIAFAPQDALGGNFLATAWPDVATAVQVSTYSLPALAVAVLPLLRPGAGIVGLDFDASVAWADYDWMGVAKAGLESAARYLARDLGPRGIRVNLVAAGPLQTMAARNIPGHDDFERTWDERAPLGWKASDQDAAARTCVALLSDWLPVTTGEIVHADGGYHAMGA